MSSSDSDDDNAIRYGTPLEPYEEDEVPTKRKFQQAPDQFAVDANGRRRFHGAFTGGFSAGFGNTVGSLEGWTPSTFKSSRTEKAQTSSQRPEDFMDEEDRGEFGIAPRLLRTHDDFSGQKRPRQKSYHDGPIPGVPVLAQLLRAVRDAAAVRMLRALGWRAPPRRRRVDGCQLPQKEQLSDEDSSEVSECEFETLFAPDDYEPYVLSRKSDRFGLGYCGLSRRAVLGGLAPEYGGAAPSTSHLRLNDKGKKVSIRGQAFGVGAFEADDEDIYATEDMSHYDFALGGTPAITDKLPTKSCSKHALAGFVRGERRAPPAPPPAPPAPPRDYVPAPAGARRSRFEPTAHKERDQGLGRHELTAEARGALLGEEPAPPAANSPTVTHTPQQTQDLTKLLGKSINFTTNTEKKELDFISITDSGEKLVKVFKPFAGNVEKQARYEKYLEDRSGVLERDNNTDRLSEWERERELLEFEQAAKLYKPLSGVMRERFTHASGPDDALDPLCAVARSAARRGLATPQQMEAAQRGVYGALTRQRTEWKPEGLVSKRFNLPEVGGVRIEQKKEEKPKISYSVFSYLESSVHDRDSFAREQSKFSGSKSMTSKPPTKSDVTSKMDDIDHKNRTLAQNIDQNKNLEQKDTGSTKRMTVAELFLKESEQNKQQGAEVTETINNFDKMDLYKSIFLSDSEEEIVENNIKDKTDFIEVPKNTERNNSPPRGIFANIDFDELNSWKRRDDRPKDSVPTDVKNAENKDVSINEEMYGPKLPENIPKVSDSKESRVHEIMELGSSSSGDSWVDVNDLKSKKNKKKKSKKHKSKHKKKSKHKSKDK